MAVHPDMDLTPMGIADFAANLLTALAIDKTMIIANDTGGAYAQVFTAEYPHFVSHLVLSNCEGFEIFPPKKFQSIKKMVKIPGYLWLLAKLFTYKPSLKWNLTFGLLSHQLKKEELYGLYVKNFSESKLVREDFKKLALGWDPKYTLKASEKLLHYKNPVLILWGKDDTELFPIELGKRLASLFAHSIFVEISNALTYVQEDNPRECIEHIVSFAKQNGLIPCTEHWLFLSSTMSQLPFPA